DDAERRLTQGGIGEAGLLNRLQHGAAEAARGHALLEGHDEALATCLVQDQLAVERLRESRVDYADRPAFLGERIGRLEGPHDDRAEADEKQVVALAQDLCLADRDLARLDRRQAEARIARVVQRERMRLPERAVEQR